MSQADEPPVTNPQPSASWWGRLWEPCDIASVVFFRIAFAGIMLLHVALFFRNGWIDYYFADSPYHLRGCLQIREFGVSSRLSMRWIMLI